MKKVFLLFLFPSALFCQAEFIENDKFGLSGGYTFANNEAFNSSSFDFVLTTFGDLDIGFEKGSGKLDDEYSPSQISTTATLVYTAYNFKRINNNLVLKVLAGYYMGTAENPGNRISSSGLLLGLGAYPRVLTAKQFSIRVAIELSYGFLSTSNSQSYYNDDSEFDNSRSISLGLNLVADITKNFHFILSPFAGKDLLRSEDSFYFGLNSRLFISFEHRNNTH
jgi:hypothetical protein